MQVETTPRSCLQRPRVWAVLEPESIGAPQVLLRICVVVGQLEGVDGGALLCFPPADQPRLLKGGRQRGTVPCLRWSGWGRARPCTGRQEERRDGNEEPTWEGACHWVISRFKIGSGQGRCHSPQPRYGSPQVKTCHMLPPPSNGKARSTVSALVFGARTEITGFRRT